MHPASPAALAIAAGVGLLAGTHTAIWGMYKDVLHEGFAPARFARSIVVGTLAAVAIQLAFALPMPRPAALVLLFGLAYAAERGAVEVWKSFVRVEDQSKYFIPMAFSVRGAPVASRALRLAAGVAYVGVVSLALLAVARVDVGGVAPLPAARTALAGLGGGMLVALGGAWKDAPCEGFDPLKFLRSPSMTVLFALVLGWLTSSYLLAAVAAIGFERATVETWKKFTDPHCPPGKFAGKPVLHPHMRAVRRRFVPVFVAIWLAVLGSGAIALTTARSVGRRAQPTGALVRS